VEPLTLLADVVQEEALVEEQLSWELEQQQYWQMMLLPKHPLEQEQLLLE
jgi:hypothetical protein